MPEGRDQAPGSVDAPVAPVETEALETRPAEQRDAEARRQEPQDRQRPSLVIGPQMDEAIARLDENLEVPYDVLGVLARCFGHLLLSRLDDQTFIHHKHLQRRLFAPSPQPARSF